MRFFLIETFIQRLYIKSMTFTLLQNIYIPMNAVIFIYQRIILKKSITVSI